MRFTVIKAKILSNSFSISRNSCRLQFKLKAASLPEHSQIKQSRQERRKPSNILLRLKFKKAQGHIQQRFKLKRRKPNQNPYAWAPARHQKSLKTISSFFQTLLTPLVGAAFMPKLHKRLHIRNRRPKINPLIFSLP